MISEWQYQVTAREVYGEQAYADAAEREDAQRRSDTAAWAEQQAATDEPNPDAPYSDEKDTAPCTDCGDQTDHNICNGEIFICPDCEAKEHR